MVPVKNFNEGRNIIFVTRRGLVKKTPLIDYGNPRRDGIIAIDIVEGDSLIDAQITEGTCDIILGTRRGMAIRFREDDVRRTGRNTRGVKGITLARKGDAVVGMVVVRREGFILAVAENGYGKRTKISDYNVQHRGGRGVITIKCSDRNGDVLTLQEVVDSDELMLVTHNGLIIRQGAREISVMGRNTQGVRLMHMGEGDVVVDIARVAEEKINGGEDGMGDGMEDGEGDGDDVVVPYDPEVTEEAPAGVVAAEEESPIPDSPVAVKKTGKKKAAVKNSASKKVTAKKADTKKTAAKKTAAKKTGEKNRAGGDSG